MASIRNDWNLIRHLHQTQLDKLSKMIGVYREQSALRFNVSKRPNEIDRTERVYASYAAHLVLIHCRRPMPVGTHPTSAVLPDAGYFANRVTLSLALRSSGDAGRGVGRIGAAAALVAG